MLYLNICIEYKRKSNTNLAIDINPQDAVACNGVHPSLSPQLISAPFSTKNSTISRSSLIHAYN